MRIEVKVYPVKVEDHPNPEVRLKVAKIGDFKSLVKDGDFQTGDLVAYIPEDSVVPDSILEEIGLKGKLAGKQKNRVKAIKLQKTLSQGILYPAKSHWKVGDEVSEELGITKWEPPIPASFQGDLLNIGSGWTLKYDIKNIKYFPDIIQEGEEVIFTEKIHGTNCMVGLLPEEYKDTTKGRVVVASKGISHKGLAFKYDSPNNDRNIYIRTSKALDLPAKIESVFGSQQAVYVYGEIFGHGVQDLTYGHSANRDQEIGFRVFDIYLGKPGEGRFLDYPELKEKVQDMGLTLVPVLYEGPYSLEKREVYVNGHESITGKNLHIREGIVIRPLKERTHPDVEALNGRVQFKHISENYLVRKGGTEFN